MQYRKLKADKIFNGFTWLKENEVVIVSESGVIHDIFNEEDAGNGVEHLHGIITPGFINCHCHLELSHLKNAVPDKTGMVNFLLSVVKLRASSNELILEHAKKAEREMADNGIVAVADVCNTSLTIDIKRKSSLYFHNLIEVINLYDENLEKQFAHFSSVLDLYNNIALGSTNTLTPHAPYSVSPATFRAINDATPNAIISIHNQESEAENQLFQNGQGDFLNLYKGLGAEKFPITVTNKTSLQTWLPYFTKGQTILLVHNSFISEEDIVFAKTHAEKYGLELIYCLCANANLFIENQLPPVGLLAQHDCKIVLGTDSYSSNWQLSIAAELKTVKDHLPNFALEEILKWATVNGAGALKQSSLGSIEKGKNPGLVLLETNLLNDELITGKSTRII